MTETLNTFEEAPQEATAEHDAAMLEKAEQLEQNNNPERPEWLPTKFESPEAMALAYASLERKLGSGQQEESQTEEQPTESEEAELPDDADLEEMENAVEAQASEVAEALDNAGLDFSDFQEEYIANGELSDEAYQALQQAGFNRDLVDSWIAGQEALMGQTTQSVFSMVGGEESYSQMTEWAGQNLSPAEIEAFNANVESGDSALVQFAVQGLYARYRSDAPSEPNLMQGQATTNQGGAFSSAAELTAAMSDPRYHKDPAYRQAVASKLARSNVF
jgi:hypothetical protein